MAFSKHPFLLDPPSQKPQERHLCEKERKKGTLLLYLVYSGHSGHKGRLKTAEFEALHNTPRYEKSIFASRYLTCFAPPAYYHSQFYVQRRTHAQITSTQIPPEKTNLRETKNANDT